MITQNITFPRSGHHALVSILEKVTDDIHYYEKYSDKPKPANANFIKNHDFDLKTQYFQLANYIVTIREPWECIPSYFTLEKKTHDLDLDYYGWMKFCNTALIYYRDFYNKWVKDPRENVMVIWYGDLIKKPFMSMKAILDWCDFRYTDDKLVEVLKENPLEYKNNYKDFKHYNEDYFKQIKDFYKELISD
jgi:hypothetical protein